MRLPDFFVIGAAKAGTTSLHAHLAHHPDLFMSRPKEPEFFARDDLYAKGIESYAPLFEGAQPGQLCGESSTIYTLSPLFPETAARVRAHVPEAKFVYMMREPVARAYSFYVQLVKNRQNETHDYSVGRSFEEFLYGDRAEIAPASAFFAPFDAHLPDRPELLTAGSLYLAQIESWLAHFPRERFLFLTFEAFIRDQKAVTEQVLRFLGVDPARMPDIPEPASTVPTITCAAVPRPCRSRRSTPGSARWPDCAICCRPHCARGCVSSSCAAIRRPARARTGPHRWRRRPRWSSSAPSMPISTPWSR